jgi:hypothetical protein
MSIIIVVDSSVVTYKTASDIFLVKIMISSKSWCQQTIEN